MKFIQYIFIVIVFFMSSNRAISSMPTLYPHEQLLTLNGVQSLIYFVKGNPHKPLIIFVPGNANLARIGYGYPEGDSKDFLAYWINKQGYSFLGVSYPMDNKVYSQIYPKFNIKERNFINEIPIKLTINIHGNHMFFIGQKGAHETAMKINLLIKNVAIINKKLAVEIEFPGSLATVSR
jgi:hypothetical protein